jgi:iron-sulfur cluster repair protein YtfE (RIC family)
MTGHMNVHKDMLIEDLIRELPEAVRYLRQHDIKCLECGEPIWGTLAAAARQKGYTEDDIARFVEDLAKMAASQSR